MITLKTLPQATEQEVFDQAASHLLAQNKKSIAGAVCKYKCADGTSCAAGCFIGEDEYNPELEGNGWNALVFAKKVPPDHMTLIMRLQCIHDGSHPKYWRDLLEQFAKKYNLNFKL